MELFETRITASPPNSTDERAGGIGNCEGRAGGIGFLVGQEIADLRSAGVGAQCDFDGVQDKGPEVGIFAGLPAGACVGRGERFDLQLIRPGFQATGGVVAVLCRRDAGISRDPGADLIPVARSANPPEGGIPPKPGDMREAAFGHPRFEERKVGRVEGVDNYRRGHVRPPFLPLISNFRRPFRRRYCPSLRNSTGRPGVHADADDSGWREHGVDFGVE